MVCLVHVALFAHIGGGLLGGQGWGRPRVLAWPEVEGHRIVGPFRHRRLRGSRSLPVRRKAERKVHEASGMPLTRGGGGSRPSPVWRQRALTPLVTEPGWLVKDGDRGGFVARSWRSRSAAISSSWGLAALAGDEKGRERRVCHPTTRPEGKLCPFPREGERRSRFRGKGDGRDGVIMVAWVKEFYCYSI